MIDENKLEMEGAETNEINDNTSSMSSTTVAADNVIVHILTNKLKTP